MKTSRRWYDDKGELAGFLESFQRMKPEERDRQIKRIMRVIKENQPRLFEDFVSDFPLDVYRRRWYDRDPYLWLLFNGLQFAGQDLLDKVTRCF